ncbi:hypothetical protein QFI91_15830 [Raoultella sp. WB_B2P2-3]|uniref:Uncharacterized protein n=1 Tax=Raoultella scottii TaxID=3040937 RepID=A0ABU8ZA38_9ENTR
MTKKQKIIHLQKNSVDESDTKPLKFMLEPFLQQVKEKLRQKVRKRK